MSAPITETASYESEVIRSMKRLRFMQHQVNTTDSKDFSHLQEKTNGKLLPDSGSEKRQSQQMSADQHSHVSSAATVVT